MSPAIALLPAPAPDDVALVLEDGRAVLPAGWEEGAVPRWHQVQELVAVGPHPAGTYRARPVFAAALGEVPPGLESVALRTVLQRGPEDLGAALGLAAQVVEWATAHRFCGRCGTPTRWRPEEPRALSCPNCGAQHFPRINPAVITVVHRGDEILLAHNQRMPPGYFALVAGFVEPGETMEQTVRREVQEEVSLEIADPVYQGSQPWPFPSQLMAGFFAAHRSGEIAVDAVEIGEAEWFRYDRLPETPRRPPPYTIAGRLIQRWLDQHAR